MFVCTCVLVNLFLFSCVCVCTLLLGQEGPGFIFVGFRCLPRIRSPLERFKNRYLLSVFNSSSCSFAPHFLPGHRSTSSAWAVGGVGENIFPPIGKKQNKNQRFTFPDRRGAAPSPKKKPPIPIRFVTLSHVCKGRQVRGCEMVKVSCEETLGHVGSGAKGAARQTRTIWRQTHPNARAWLRLCP